LSLYILAVATQPDPVF